MEHSAPSLHASVDNYPDVRLAITAELYIQAGCGGLPRTTGNPEELNTFTVPADTCRAIVRPGPGYSQFDF